jgi:two-component system response regulator VicR
VIKLSKILVVEDEELIAEMIQFNLEKSGYEVEVVYDGLAAVQKANSINPELILLDIMLPGINGFEVCRQIRRTHNMPIIMLTAKETENDKVQGLKLGADDYITKPFSPQELIARVNAQLRRANVFNNHLNQSQDKLIFDELVIDCKKYEVTRDGEVISLTIREFELLNFLASKPEEVFSREELLKEVWGYNEFFGDDRTVDVTVRRLREKIEDEPSKPNRVITKRGAGYYFKG